MRKTLTIAGAILAAALWTVPAGAQDSGGLQPSEAVRRAVAAVPGSEPLGVKRKGQVYVVRLKQNGAVVQVIVDAATGDVSAQ